MFRHDLGTVLKKELERIIKETYDTTVDFFPELPPRLDMGDVAFSCALPLARVARAAPRAVAEKLLQDFKPGSLVSRIDIAGPGYLNVFLARSEYLKYLGRARFSSESVGDKVIVEHTNINPNKAAHIGHLRNAIIGDTLARCLAFAGYRTEIQNYIDDTGVQVADVVAGLLYLEERTWESIIQTETRPDFYTWDLYARVNRIYDDEPDRKNWRGEVLHRIEEGNNEVAELASKVASTMMDCHIQTMERLGIRYNLLPRESDILRLGFWQDAFELLKKTGKIFFARDGEFSGCWVMDLKETGEPDKILVRSNGTLTYVAKDIAYQMWKFGLLGKDFYYSRRLGYPSGNILWQTESQNPSDTGSHPSFGRGNKVYNVIDARQSYLQKVVRESLRVCGFSSQAEQSIHFAYEMVTLSEKFAAEMGFTDAGGVTMSGRKGLGVKADDLLDTVEKKSYQEVKNRHPELDDEELVDLGKKIAVAAVKFFNLKYGVNKVIAFDLEEALSFEGDSGPYLQYSVVRAASILKKLKAAGRPFQSETIDWDIVTRSDIDDDAWIVVRTCGELPEVVRYALESLDLSAVARFALDLSALFHHFYHTSPILQESDEGLFHMRLAVLLLFIRTETLVLDLMGIEVPDRM